MVLHRQHTDGDGHDAGEQGTALGRPADMQEEDIDDATSQTAGRVDLLAENQGHFIDEDVTQHTTTGTRDAAQNDGSPCGEAQGQ